MNKYIFYKDLKEDEIKYINKIPKIIHRTLLFDNDFPDTIKPTINHFNIFVQDYIKILWRLK